MTTIQITVPGTTANIGPGFDCLGAALTLANRFQFTVVPDSEPEFSLKAVGSGAEQLTANRDNLLYRSFCHLFEHLGEKPPHVSIAIEMFVPLSRGLGSSATAIVGGLMAANQFVKKPLSTTALLNLAIAIEGHSDNVVPAFFGGCQLSVNHQQKWVTAAIAWHPEIIPVLAIPNFELSTAKARSVLPEMYHRAQAIFNMSRLGLLTQGLAQNDREYLQAALDDQIHQPYRKALIPGYDEVQLAAIQAGAYGMVISGAGPTLLALTDKSQAEPVAIAMKNAWATINVKADTRILALSQSGACVEEIA